MLCERGLNALAPLPESRSRDEQELGFSLTLGMAMMSTRGYAAPEVELTYRRARELCLKLSDVRRLVPVLWAIHTCVTNAGQLSESLDVALEMRRAADALDDKESIVESLHAHGTTLAFMGRLREARQTLEQVFTIAPIAQHEVRGSLDVIDPLVTSLSMLARVVTLLGDVEWGRVVRGAALAQLGRRTQGIADMRQSIQQQEAMGSRLERPYCLTLLAEALLADGEAAQALALCEQALELANRTQSLDFQSETHRLRAEALSALGHPERAVRIDFDAALRLARDADCRLLERRLERTRPGLFGRA